MKKQGLIFDLDGTLTLTQQYHYLAFQHVIAAHGGSYTEADDLGTYASMGSSILFPTFFANHGRTLTEDEIKQYGAEKREIYNTFIRQQPIEVVPGVVEFLEQMKARGTKMAVASGNKLEAIEYLLEAAGIRKYFDLIMTAKEAGKPKPDPDIFLACAEKFGLPVEACAVFEDAVAGIEAAESGGMKSVGVVTRATPEALRAAGADLLINNYTEITPDIVDAL